MTTRCQTGTREWQSYEVMWTVQTVDTKENKERLWTSWGIGSVLVVNADHSFILHSYVICGLKYIDVKT